MMSGIARPLQLCRARNTRVTSFHSRASECGAEKGHAQDSQKEQTSFIDFCIAKPTACIDSSKKANESQKLGGTRWKCPVIRVSCLPVSSIKPTSTGHQQDIK